MMLNRSRWPTLAAPSITAVIVGAAMFAPSMAHAECGSYVVYTNPAQLPAESRPMGEHKFPTGCDGPNCSQVPTPTPMPQAPPSPRILADETLIISTGNSLVPTSSQGVPIDR